MGYVEGKITVRVNLNNHNSWRDDRDKAIFEGLKDAITVLIDDEEWKAIEPEIWSES